MNDFNKRTIRKLAAKGITIIGLQALPGQGSMPWATAERGYKVNDNGCGRVWTHDQVTSAAK